MSDPDKFDPVDMMDKLRSIPIGEAAAETYLDYLAAIPNHGIASHHQELCEAIDEVFEMHDFPDEVLDASRQATKASIMAQKVSPA